MNEWGHGIAEWVAIVVTIVLYSAAQRRSDKKDLDERRREAKAEQDKRHIENQDKLDTLIEEGKFFPAHGHREKKGGLTVDGLRYPPGKDPRGNGR